MLARGFHTSRQLLQSSCKEGTKISLAVFKGAPAIVAKADSEYPEWLWDILDKEKQLEQLKQESPFKYQRKLVKKANVEAIKMKNFMSKKK